MERAVARNRRDEMAGGAVMIDQQFTDRLRATNPNLVAVIWPDSIVPMTHPDVKRSRDGNNYCVRLHGVKFIFNDAVACQKFERDYLKIFAPWIKQVH